MEAGILEGLMVFLAQYPMFMTVMSVIGILRLINKPLFSFLRAIADATPGVWDNEMLDKVESSKGYKTVAYILDWFTSVKLPVKKEEAK